MVNKDEYNYIHKLASCGASAVFTIAAQVVNRNVTRYYP